MVNGYVNTETNYFMDNRLNLLNESTYNIANKHNNTGNTEVTNLFANKNNSNNTNTNNEYITGNNNNYNSSSNQNGDQLYATNSCTTSELQQGSNLRGHTLIDILRVYYEFGPMVCGLVNLIDFVPKFYSTKPNSVASQSNNEATASSSASGRETPDQSSNTAAGGEHSADSKPNSRPTEKIAPTESLTRLIRYSLAWFESERKRILDETSGGSKHYAKLIDDDQPVQPSTSGSSSSTKPVNLRVCNLQVYQKTFLKNQLVHVNPTNALEIVNTRSMVHERAASGPAIVCGQCSISTSNDPVQNWCQHVHQLSQPYNLKFVRLAYVVPVYNRYALSICSLRPSLRVSSKRESGKHDSLLKSQPGNEINNDEQAHDELERLTSSSSSSESEASSEYSSPFLITNKHNDSSSSNKQSELFQKKPITSSDDCEVGKASFSNSGDQSSSMADSSFELDRKTVEHLLDGKEEELTKKAALNIVYGTNSRHRQDEELNQLNQNDNGLNDSPIGQLTYRLFAPCQLVNSSSCFSINPVNSSSPLARRGSVDLNGSGISSENAQPSTYLLGAQQGGSSTATEPQQVVTSFGAFFPALSSDIAMSSGGLGGSGSGGNSLIGAPNIDSSNFSNNSSNKSSNQPPTGASRFTTNEFESVDAIKRRMEIYVTTNSMKVIAGETLIVNLSDVLSCLSTAIEQTCAKASFGQRRSTSWVSVYILYAAVEEPQLPNQLLAQQKLRGLTLIDESVEENDTNEQRSKEEKQQQLGLDNKGETTKNLFDDDFTGSFDNKVSDSEEIRDKELKVTTKTQQQQQVPAITTSGSQTIRVEQNPYDSSLTLYNSAYDRTVALPTQPDNHLDISEPFECQTDCLWLNENDVIETLVDQMAQPDSELESSRKRRKKKKKKKSKKQHEDSQCSIM